MDILKKLALEKNKTIILSLHEIELVSKIADHVMLIDEGHVFAFGSPATVINDANIQKVYNIEYGSYNSLLGSIELPKNSDVPKVYVIGGNSTGVDIYRALNKDGINFYSGILFENDLDFEVSKNLALKTLWQKPFIEISDDLIKQGMELIDTVGIIVDCAPQYIGINKKNSELLNYAIKKEKLILSLENNSVDDIIQSIKESVAK